jgi:hypothetical protein
LRGDIILNPLDKRCPYWGPADELRSRSEAKALAASLFQPRQDKKGEFFIESPQKISAFLMAYGPRGCPTRRRSTVGSRARSTPTLSIRVRTSSEQAY